MIRRISVLALGLALAAPASAHAVGTKSYNVCGGSYGSSWSGFAFCASVQLSVTKKPNQNIWTVAMTVANMSGLNGSYLWSVFDQIGLDNVQGSLSTPANIIVKQGNEVVCSNPYNNQSSQTGCWNIVQDQQADGNFKIDFLNRSANGLTRDISSQCWDEPTLLYTCLAADPVTVQFDINKDFNPNTAGNVYIHSTTILDWQIVETQCTTFQTTPDNMNAKCTNVAQFVTPNTPPVTATPEPATLALLGTGMFALGGPGFIRRRRQKAEAAKQA
jgi:hypothetical protein